MGFSVEVTSRLSAGFRRAASFLNDEGRQEASQAMGEEVQLIVVAHLRSLAQSRHTTANRLGATPSNFLAQAADAAGVAGVVRADTEGVTLAIRHPAVARAFRDIHIQPKTAKKLAIPVNAIAYNRRPAQLWESLHLFATPGAIWMPQGKGNPPLMLYVRVRSVTQRQDRSLMPSDQEINDAAALGLKGYITRALQGGRL